MNNENMPTQFLYCIQGIDTAFRPVARISAYTKIAMTFQGHKCCIRIPVMTTSFPMFMDSYFYSISTGEAIDLVPHIQWRLGGHVFPTQLFGNVKLLYP